MSYYDSSPISVSDNYEYDGSRSNQAAVTIDLYVQPVPGKSSDTRGHYYKSGAENAQSAVLRGDWAVVEVDRNLMMTESGPLNSACFASFANREAPSVDDPDAFCNKYRVVGAFKNTMTNPEDAFFAAHQGIPRIASQQAAIQAAGSCTVPYTRNQPVMIGDPVIWYPPEVKPSHRRDERPLPELGPLHWSLLNNLIRSICVCMLHLQSGKKSRKALQFHQDPVYKPSNDSEMPGTWAAAAMERKRSILITVMAALYILVKRGYLLILSPKISKELAFKERLIARLQTLDKTPGATANDWKAVYGEYTKSMDSLKNDSEKDKGNFNYYYYETNSAANQHSSSGFGAQEADIRKVNRDNDWAAVTNAVIGDTTKEAMDKDKKQEASLVWMIQNFGLGNNPDGYREQAANNTIFDILSLLSSCAVEGSEVNTYTSSRGTQFYASDTSKDVTNFKSHLKNYTAEQEVAYMRLRDSICRRTVGQALSSACAGRNAGKTGESGCTLDINIGGTIF